MQLLKICLAADSPFDLMEKMVFLEYKVVILLYLTGSEIMCHRACDFTCLNNNYFFLSLLPNITGFIGCLGMLH